MKITDERKLLPIVRDAVSGRETALASLIESIKPLFDSFIQSGKESDKYNGWAFDLTFIGANSPSIEPYASTLVLSDTWTFLSEGKDDCSYVVPRQGIIKIHLHSFLWNL